MLIPSFPRLLCSENAEINEDGDQRGRGFQRKVHARVQRTSKFLWVVSFAIEKKNHSNS